MSSVLQFTHDTSKSLWFLPCCACFVFRSQCWQRRCNLFLRIYLRLSCSCRCLLFCNSPTTRLNLHGFGRVVYASHLDRCTDDGAISFHVSIFELYPQVFLNLPTTTQLNLCGFFRIVYVSHLDRSADDEGTICFHVSISIWVLAAGVLFCNSPTTCFNLRGFGHVVHVSHSGRSADDEGAICFRVSISVWAVAAGVFCLAIHPQHVYIFVVLAALCMFRIWIAALTMKEQFVSTYLSPFKL